MASLVEGGSSTKPRDGHSWLVYILPDTYASKEYFWGVLTEKQLQQPFRPPGFPLLGLLLLHFSCGLLGLFDFGNLPNEVIGQRPLGVAKSGLKAQKAGHIFH